MSIHIIADACTNHDGNFEKAIKLLTEASESGADSVKFQIINPKGLYIEKIMQGDGLCENPIIAIRGKNQLSDRDYCNLANIAQSRGIILSGSVFDRDGLDLLKKINAPYIKLASCDLNNYYFIQQAADLGKTIIISTGMGNLSEIEMAIESALKMNPPKIVLMHCTSVYPSETRYTKLEMIKVLKHYFGFEVGFSDHTLDSRAAVAAVALGATWFEKHFTISNEDDGFDHKHSATPSVFMQYVNDLRATALACGPITKRMLPQEAELKTRARRGIYAATALKKGDVITPEKILVVRPEAEITADKVELILNKAVDEDVQKFAPIPKSIIN